ncbi:MAG: hypothetical protein RIQ94_172 [Pseudomonadota bacterium]|jgi:hypothetical protein
MNFKPIKGEVIMDREKIGILIGEASTLFGFYGDSFDSKRAKEITDEISNEFADLEKKYTNLKKMLTHLCDVWDEKCESNCDEWGHVEECRVVNLFKSKRALNKENARTKEQLKIAIDTLDAVTKCNYLWICLAAKKALDKINTITKE